MKLGTLNDLLESPLLAAVRSREQPGLLMLDYDGTLAPFNKDRERAVPYPGVVEILSTLPVTGSHRYVLISGRKAREAARMLGINPSPETWGCHGLERLLPSGKLHTSLISTRLRTALARARAEARAWPAPPAALETKGTSLCMHVRGLPEEEASVLLSRTRSAWGRIAEQNDLELLPFDGGLELRQPGSGKDKAVLRLLREHPESILAYLGDDLTDEDAFKVMGKDSLPILACAAPRRTGALFHIRPPEEVLHFLRAWAGLE